MNTNRRRRAGKYRRIGDQAQSIFKDQSRGLALYLMFQLRIIEAEIKKDLLAYMVARRSRVPKEGEDYAPQIADILKCLNDTLDRFGGPPPEFFIEASHDRETRTASFTIQELIKS